jgi:hypothetical protein
MIAGFYFWIFLNMAEASVSKAGCGSQHLLALSLGQ